MTAEAWVLTVAVQHLLVAVAVASIMVPRTVLSWRLRHATDGYGAIRTVMLLWGYALILVSSWQALVWLNTLFHWLNLPPQAERAPLNAAVWLFMDAASLLSLWLYWRRT